MKKEVRAAFFDELQKTAVLDIAIPILIGINDKEKGTSAITSAVKGAIVAGALNSYNGRYSLQLPIWKQKRIVPAAAAAGAGFAGLGRLFTEEKKDV